MIVDAIEPMKPKKAKEKPRSCIPALAIVKTSKVKLKKVQKKNPPSYVKIDKFQKQLPCCCYW